MLTIMMMMTLMMRKLMMMMLLMMINLGSLVRRKQTESRYGSQR